MSLLSTIDITSESVTLNGRAVPVSGTGVDMLNSIYRDQIGGYPKYFKMDTLCRLGFVASELMLAGETDRFTPRSDRAVVMVNKSGSLCDDEKYQSTIADADNYFPSPSVFVYTLPNIVTGEIAIRNKYNGETSFMVLESYDAAVIADMITAAFRDGETGSVLGGWLECSADDAFRARLALVDRDTPGELLKEFFNKTNI